MKKKFFKLNMIFYNIQLWSIFKSTFIINFIPKGKNQKVVFPFTYKQIHFFLLELIQKREEIVSRFTELSQAVQPLLDAVVTEDAARLIEHQRYIIFSVLSRFFLPKGQTRSLKR
jgi:hypothetical protein